MNVFLYIYLIVDTGLGKKVAAPVLKEIFRVVTFLWGLY